MITKEKLYLVKFYCETYPVDPLRHGGYKGEEKERIELFEDLRTKRERDEIIKGLVFRGRKK